MFGFGKKKTPTQKDSEIFSADEAKQMVVDALIKKRNEDRMTVFNAIKAMIKGGHKSYIAPPYLFENGNDTYFEGLGYKLKRLWYDSWTGQYLETEPVDEQPDLIDPPPNNGGTGGAWGGVWDGQFISSGATRTRQRSYQPHIKLSWE